MMNEYIERIEYHRQLVKKLMNGVADNIRKRGEVHDDSKLIEPELSLGAKQLQELKGIKYNSAEYHSIIKKYSEANGTHYRLNDHHPEHHPNGINDMTLVHLIEMLADWTASINRGETIDLEKTIEGIEINAERFGISEQLKNILINSIK